MYRLKSFLNYLIPFTNFKASTKLTLGKSQNISKYGFHPYFREYIAIGQVNYCLVNLPFSLQHYKMLIFLPDDDVDRLENRLLRQNAANTKSLSRLVALKKIRLRMPKFKTLFDTGLVNAFRNLGVSDPFSTDR